MITSSEPVISLTPSEARTIWKELKGLPLIPLSAPIPAHKTVLLSALHHGLPPLWSSHPSLPLHHSRVQLHSLSWFQPSLYSLLRLQSSYNSQPLLRSSHHSLLLIQPSLHSRPLYHSLLQLHSHPRPQPSLTALHPPVLVSGPPAIFLTPAVPGLGRDSSGLSRIWRLREACCLNERQVVQTMIH